MWRQPVNYGLLPSYYYGIPQSCDILISHFIDLVDVPMDDHDGDELCVN